jgi:hypothetical protein
VEIINKNSGQLEINELNENEINIVRIDDEIFDVIVKFEDKGIENKCWARTLYVNKKENSIKMCDEDIELGILTSDLDTTINVYENKVEIEVTE